MKKILFVCSRNKLRSPTAERVFGEHEVLDVRSGGLNNDAETRVGVDDIRWAEYIFVMEPSHKKRLRRKFGKHLKDQRVVCLEIPDKYEYMDKELVRRLKQKVRHLL